MTAQPPPGRPAGADVERMLARHVIDPEESEPVCFHCGDVWPCIVSELATELAALRAERDAIRAELTEFHAYAEVEVKAWQARSDKHRARAERAEAALRKYAEHDDFCKSLQMWRALRGECDCGLADALAAPTEPEGEKGI